MANNTDKNFISPQELAATFGGENYILDPYSVLIAQDVTIGKGNVFYPNVVIERSGAGQITIGDGNVFFPGTFIFCSNGSITIESGNEFGTGGCTIKANMEGAEIMIGSGGRYSDGASIMGKTTLGSGSQVLGAITVQSCVLASGGSYQEPDPDKRGAVLKGFGLARGINLKPGEVINHIGTFSDATIELQRSYHPKKA